MKAFKITIPDRSVRRAVMAGSFEELVEKAKEKLSIEDDISIILEEDGTVIDDWEIAQAFSEKPLMILTVAKKWPENNGTIFEECTLRLADTESTASSSVTVDWAVPEHGSVYLPSRPTEPAPNIVLPTLSPYVSKKLEEGRPFDVWSKFIEEMAYGLLSSCVMATRSEYEKVGKAVYRRYPCIGLINISKKPLRPWNAFVKSLSQKIRHIRWTEKKRTNAPADKPTLSKSHSLAKLPCPQVDFGEDLNAFSLDAVKLEKILPNCDD